MKSKKVMIVVSCLFYRDEIDVGSRLTGHWWSWIYFERGGGIARL
jgi:hypothetical protein